MKSFLLIGLGRFGRHIAMKLGETNHQVLAIDKQEERVNQVLPFVTNAQIGDSTDLEYLATLGVDNFDVCIVAIAHDFESSLITTNALKELGAPKVIARACQDVQEKLLLRNGADVVVYPEKREAHWTAIRYSSDMILDYFGLTDGYSIIEVSLPRDWAGKSIGELDIRRKFSINILGTKTNGTLDMNTSIDTRFKEGQSLLVVGKDDDIQNCFHI